METKGEQLKKVKSFVYLDGIAMDDGKCEFEIKSRIAVAIKI